MPEGNGGSFFMLNYLSIMFGGALGTGARFWLSGFIAQRYGSVFPLGTLTVNVTGCFIIGIFAAFTESDSRFLVSPGFRQFFMIGVCGGYTTFLVLWSANARSHQRWRLVESRTQYRALGRVLPGCGMAGPRSRSHSHFQIRNDQMKLPSDAILLRIFLGESDRWQHQPLYEAIVLKARELHLAGATVLRGPMGFGAASLIHTAKILRLSMDLPMVIEIVDTEEKVNSFLPALDEMMGSGLVTLEKVKVIRYRHVDK